MLEKITLDIGDNFISPKVGGSPASIRKAIARYKAAGYTVEIVNMHVTFEEAYRRMIARFIATGRLIPPDYVRKVGKNPSVTFRTLKEEGQADGFGEIDNNGPIDGPKLISEISGSNPFAGSRYDLEGSRGNGRDLDGGGTGNAGKIAPQGRIVATA